MHNIRDQFPILQRQIHGKPLVFLDSAASAQKPKCVIDAMVNVMNNHYANINRGVYLLSEESTGMVEVARDKIALFINAQTEEIVFTRNATEAINLVAYSWGRHNLKRGDVVLLTEMEHHANIVPWQMLRDEIGIEIEWIRVNDLGYLEWGAENISGLQGRIKLVCLTHVSNVLGTINPVKEIIEWVHSIGAKVLVDGAQGVTNVAVDVNALGCDWYVFSGHKLYGPTGVGVLYGKKELLEDMPPFMGGGDMILEVHKDRVAFKGLPGKFEAGTPAIVEIIGLGAAIDFIQCLGMDEIRKHSLELLNYAYSKLLQIEGLIIYGPQSNEDRGAVLAFSLHGAHPHDVATILDEEGVAIRSGHHCAQPLCDRFGQAALARISFGVYNSCDDIDALIVALKRVQNVFGLI